MMLKLLLCLGLLVFVAPSPLLRAEATPDARQISVTFTSKGDIVYDGVTYLRALPEANILTKELSPSGEGEMTQELPPCHEEEELEVGSNEWWMYFGATCLCTICAALAAGLTMGMVSIDRRTLQIIQHTSLEDCTTEDERLKLAREKGYAEKILPLVGRHHLLLVTLLLMNSLANEALPLFLDKLVPSYLAIILSVTLVLFFGEIIPSSIFTGPDQLKIAASLSWLVWCMTIGFWPIAWPISKALDFCLGEEHVSSYRRSELKALVSLQTHGTAEHGALFDDDEATLLHAALEMKMIKVAEIMKPMRDVFMLDEDSMLTSQTIKRIAGSGHSRIPVFHSHPHDLRGFLLVKRLIGHDGKESTIKDLTVNAPLLVHPDDELLDVLNKMQEGVHMAFVTDDPEAVRQAYETNSRIPVDVKMAGIMTLEDVVEKLIREPIYDEEDIRIRDQPDRPASTVGGRSTNSRPGTRRMSNGHRGKTAPTRKSILVVSNNLGHTSSSALAKLNGAFQNPKSFGRVVSFSPTDTQTSPDYGSTGSSPPLQSGMLHRPPLRKSPATSPNMRPKNQAAQDHAKAH